MTVARSTGVFLGTDETTGITITTGATTTSSEIDMFGNNTSEGWINLYLKLTTGATSALFVNVTLYPGRVTGQDYVDQAPIVFTVNPATAATFKYYCGMFRIGRFMVAAVNNGLAGSITNTTLGYELFLES